MRVYLVRHGIAFERDGGRWPDDGNRPLTPSGRKRLRLAALGLGHLAPVPDAVLSSPLARAWQTAETLCEAAGWPAPQSCAALAPEGEPGGVVAALQNRPGETTLALVGHEPNLSELASYLLAGNATQVTLEFRKGSVACLQLDDLPPGGRAVLRWLAAPRLLRAIAGSSGA